MSTKIGFADDLGVSSTEISEFYKVHYQRDIALSDLGFHTWQFEKAPFNRGFNSCVVAANDSGLLGVMGLNRRKFYLSGNAINGAELTTWIVDQRIKGTGVGTKILNFITSHFDVLFGMGISQDALPIYVQSGFYYLRYIPRYIHVVDTKKVLNISDHTTYASKLVKDSSCEQHHLHAEKIFWSDQRHNPCVEGNHFSRSLEDLIWRYESHPYFKYNTYKISNSGGSFGYVVLREEITDDVKILHVIDILGSESSFENSITFVENYAKNEGFWAVDVYSTLSQLNKYFNYRSWLSAVDSSFINVPHLFHPLEVRNPATTSLIYWSKSPDVKFCDVSELYVSKQDCDLDRPTMDFIGVYNE